MQISAYVGMHTRMSVCMRVSEQERLGHVCKSVGVLQPQRPGLSARGMFAAVETPGGHTAGQPRVLAGQMGLGLNCRVCGIPMATSHLQRVFLGLFNFSEFIVQSCRSGN